MFFIIKTMQKHYKKEPNLSQFEPDQPTIIHQPPTNRPRTTDQMTTNHLLRPPTDRPRTNKKFEHQKNNNFIFYINYNFEKRVLVPYTEYLQNTEYLYFVSCTHVKWIVDQKTDEFYI